MSDKPTFQFNFLYAEQIQDQESPNNEHSSKALANAPDHSVEFSTPICDPLSQVPVISMNTQTISFPVPFGTRDIAIHGFLYNKQHLTLTNTSNSVKVCIKGENNGTVLYVPKVYFDAYSIKLEKLCETESNDMLQVVDFLISGDITLTSASLCPIFGIASRLNIIPIVSTCKQLAASLEIDKSIVELLLHHSTDDELSSICYKAIARNFFVYASLNWLNDLDFSHWQIFFTKYKTSIQCLKNNLLVLLQAVVNWATCSKESDATTKLLPQLVTYLPLKRMTGLKNFVVKHTFLQNMKEFKATYVLSNSKPGVKELEIQNDAQKLVDTTFSIAQAGMHFVSSENSNQGYMLFLNRNDFVQVTNSTLLVNGKIVDMPTRWVNQYTKFHQDIHSNFQLVGKCKIVQVAKYCSSMAIQSYRCNKHWENIKEVIHKTADVVMQTPIGVVPCHYVVLPELFQKSKNFKELEFVPAKKTDDNDSNGCAYEDEDIEPVFEYFYTGRCNLHKDQLISFAKLCHGAQLIMLCNAVQSQLIELKFVTWQNACELFDECTELTLIRKKCSEFFVDDMTNFLHIIAASNFGSFLQAMEKHPWLAFKYLIVWIEKHRPNERAKLFKRFLGKIAFSAMEYRFLEEIKSLPESAEMKHEFQHNEEFLTKVFDAMMLNGMQ